MSFVSTPNLEEILCGSNLLVDTCTMIDATKCREVKDFLLNIRSLDCTFLSIKPVKDEYTCSANNKSDYNELENFADNFIDIWLPIQDSEEPLFSIGLSRCKNIKPSYVDRQLLKILYIYRNASERIYLITSNHNDVPGEFYERIGFITHDNGGFHNIGIYKINLANFKSKTKNLT